MFFPSIMPFHEKGYFSIPKTGHFYSAKIGHNHFGITKEEEGG
jgi:hypothetical protein